MAVRAYLDNLISGLRAALPMPVRMSDWSPSLGQLLLLMATMWLFGALDDFLDVSGEPVFSIWGVESQAAYSYVWLAILSLICVLTRREDRLLAALTMAASAMLSLHVIWVVLSNAATQFEADYFQDNYRTIWMVFLGWEIAIIARVLRVATELKFRYVALHTGLYALCIYFAVTILPLRPMFYRAWDSGSTPSVDVESTYYSQANLLKQRLFELSPERSGVVDIYFIGFAAYASQDVFKREVEQATVIAEGRFDAVGRSVTLINHHETVQTVPLANRHNLDQTIAGIAAKFNREEDVLALFLTSHGSEDATIAVQFGGFGLNDIDAEDIRDTLDRHNIKWRIVIISACYSGSFIDSLQSPETVVITAASRDRTSFGCSHENDWTYFGEAFFAKALKNAPSLVAAFEGARDIIKEREEAEDKIPSTPQMFVGKAIGDYLNANGL